MFPGDSLPTGFLLPQAAGNPEDKASPDAYEVSAAKFAELDLQKGKHPTPFQLASSPRRSSNEEAPAKGLSTVADQIPWGEEGDHPDWTCETSPVASPMPTASLACLTPMLQLTSRLSF